MFHRRIEIFQRLSRISLYLHYQNDGKLLERQVVEDTFEPV